MCVCGQDDRLHSLMLSAHVIFLAVFLVGNAVPTKDGNVNVGWEVMPLLEVNRRRKDQVNMTESEN